MSLKYWISIFLLLYQFNCLLAQALVRNNEGTILGTSVHGGYHLPAEDLSKRFGDFGSIGGGADLQFQKNWLLGLEGSFFFGQHVKEDVLAPLRTTEGLLVADNQLLADVQLKMRGLYIGGFIGKVFSLNTINRRSGIRLTLGAGYFQHKIRIQNEVEAKVPAVSGSYRKGYDRLTSGLALNEFLGYQYYSRDRKLNFFAGFEFGQGFTQSRRAFDYDTMQKDGTKRFDFRTGFKIGWVLPFYVGEKAEEILY